MTYRSLIPFVVLTALLAAGSAYLAGAVKLVDPILLAAIIVGAIPLVVDIGRALINRHFGVDFGDFNQYDSSHWQILRSVEVVSGH